MKLSTKKRLELLLDKGSFQQICEDIPTHFLMGRATVGQRPIVIFAMDNQSETDTKPYDVVRVQNRIVEEAFLLRCPLVLLLDVKEQAEGHNDRPPLIPDSGRVMVGADGMGHVYYLMGRLEGKVPRICMSFGRMAGTTSFFAGLCDAVVMRDVACSCIGRPDAARKMIGEEVDFDTLGGAAMHATTTGMTDAYYETDEEVVAWGKRLLSYLPANEGADIPVLPSMAPALATVPDDEIIPDSPDRTFDMRLVIDRIIDSGSLLEMKEHYAKEVITGFARIEGRVVGIVANQSSQRMGILFPATCRKIENFVRLCDRFHIPMCFLADTPGFMVGTVAEHGGLILEATRLYTTLANAQTPRMLVVVRKVHSAGLYAMAGPGFSPVSFVALPSASMSIYGASAIKQFSTYDLSKPERESAQEMYNYATHPELFVKEGMLDEIVEMGNVREKVALFVESNY